MSATTAAPSAATTRPIRCAIYLRISLDVTGDHLAVNRQREDCHRIAKERGWTITEEYVDNSISAYSKTVKRPAYERMRKDYAAGDFDAIVCWDLDRLTRQPRQLEDWIDASEEKGLQLVTANGECDLNTTGGVLFAGIKAQVARSEMKQKGARQKRAQLQRVNLGKPPTSRALGWDRAGREVHDEAEVVRDIFTRFANGDSLRGIAAWLNESKVATRKSRHGWISCSVRGILTNARYAGRVTHLGVVVPGIHGKWDALVTEELFDSVQAILDDPRRTLNRAGTDRKHLGAGLFRCYHCEVPLRSHSGDKYRCGQAHMVRGMRQVDPFVIRVVAARLADPKLFLALAAATGDGDEAARADAEVERVQGRMAEVDKDYDAGYLKGPKYQEKMAKLEVELVKAYSDRAGARYVGHGLDAVLATAHPADEFLAAPLGVQRQIIDSLCVVTLLPATKSPKFDDTTVRIDWKHELELV